MPCKQKWKYEWAYNFIEIHWKRKSKARESTFIPRNFFACFKNTGEFQNSPQKHKTFERWAFIWPFNSKNHYWIQCVEILAISMSLIISSTPNETRAFKTS